MDMLVLTYNTFFGKKMYYYRLSYLNSKFGKDILPFENLLLLDTFAIQTLPSFFPGHRTSK